MYYDFYDEVFNAPSEVEAIILEAKQKIEDMFSAEVKQTIDDAAEAKKRLEELQQRIRDAEWKLADVNEKVKSARERAEKAELHDIPKKYISRFVREATGDLAPGDVVWVAENDGFYEACSTCKGSKKVSAQLGGKEIEVVCPECNGYGRIWKNRYKAVKRTVTCVDLKLCFHENRVGYWNRECVYLSGRENYADAKRIFRTEEEALAYIAKEAQG